MHWNRIEEEKNSGKQGAAANRKYAAGKTEKIERHDRHRLFFQLMAAALFNGYIRGFKGGKIFSGKTKSICVPVLNCYSCPGALGACPIGSLQAVTGGIRHNFPFYVLGTLMLFGTVLGRLVCGFLCPFGLFQNLLYKIPIKKVTVPGKADRILRFLKYAILVIFVILLTAKDTDSDYLAGISMGSDDYLTKPFNPMILAAKVTALLRRVRYGQEDEKKAQVEKEEIKCGNVRFDAKRHGVLVNEEELKLTPTELKFLTFMMRHFGEAVSKETLLDEIWGMDSEVQSRVADETNRRLRRKMTAAGADVYIQTVWGYGFKLTEIPE